MWRRHPIRQVPRDFRFAVGGRLPRVVFDCQRLVGVLSRPFLLSLRAFLCLNIAMAASQTRALG